MRAVFAIVVMVLSLFVAPTIAAEKPPLAEKDLRSLLQLLEGEFDNYNQIYFQTNGFIEVSDKNRYSRQHHYRQRILSEQLPGHWLYTQTNQGDKSDQVYRQTVWQFFIDAGGVINSRVWKFSDQSLRAKGLPDIEFLQQLSKDQLVQSLPAGCLMRWIKRGDQFVGTIDHKRCVIQSKYKDEKRQLFAEEIVFDGGLWMREGAYRLEGGLAFGLEPGSYYQYQRTRPFSCWVAINEAHDQDEYQDNGQWDYYSGLSTHDIGGELVFGKNRRYRLQLKQTRFPVGRYKDVMEMFVFRGAEKKAFAYSWTNPSATMIGMNLREVQGACHLVE